MRKRFFCFAIGLVLICSVFGFAQDGNVDTGSEHETIGKIFVELDTNGFSGVVLVARYGEILYKNSWGLAQQENKTPMEVGTLFYLASVSKHITATAIMQLEENGKLKTTDKISNFLDNVPEDKQNIIIEHLLHHTSGLGNMYGDYMETVTDANDLVASVMATELLSRPGEKYSYSNNGFNLLAVIIERASGKPFLDYLRDELFIPIGMEDTGTVFEQDRWPPEMVAHAYSESVDSKSHIEWQPTWKRLGAGGIITNVEDLFKFETALLSGQLIKESSLRKMMAPALNDYGYGLKIGEIDFKLYYWHSGALNGFNTYVKVYTSTQGTFILFSNDSSGFQQEMVDVLVKKLEVHLIGRRAVH